MSSGFNNSHRPGPSSDLLHSAVLLCAVPLLFFATYWLFTKTSAVSPKPLPTLADSIKTNTDELNGFFPGTGSPPPGGKWLAELDSIENRIKSVQTNATTSQQLTSVTKRLSLLRQHVTDHMRDVPEYVDETSELGNAVASLNLEVLKMQETEQVSPPISAGSKDELARIQIGEVSRRRNALQNKLQTLEEPILTAHRTQLSAVNRDIRDLEDQIQSIKDRTESARREHASRLERDARLLALQKDRAEINQLLAPFITPDFAQLGSHTGDYKMTSEKQPLSFTDLERLGAMEPTGDGLGKLLEIGGSATLGLRSHRQKGTFPESYEAGFRRAGGIETLKRAQQLLRDHKAILIEEGLMLP